MPACSTSCAMPPAGASRWCFKKISGLVDADKLKIEIDGMAFSLERVVLVERKPRIKLMKLVAAGAPNTDMLRDRFRPEIKPLEVFLMADGWVDDPGEAAACAVRMEEEGIAPLLPTGDGGYDARDSCGRWPVDDGTRRRGQTFLANNKPGRLRPKRSGSSAATDASGSSGVGGAAGPNSAVGIGRHASSRQQAACSPAHPAHHLRTHDPFSATSGAWLQRRVALVCRPLHPPPPCTRRPLHPPPPAPAAPCTRRPLHPPPMHPPCHHHYSMPSGRRL
ncbi:hypothetical protein CHLRE_01g053100v5 [Chlamydomonas reinhardtii]|uniref:Uncharacterized protein n=1 Tax=Chlamydomonas reinhardtii TaxID=3055 RepID=A0A2K3E867_CHLRE|nr:uncharacterized protein CHLRE_01g053100v5 [Chlamydomonas reinhardtii]PNW88978.1 hypothetical protein CHLRE_01g053100v5 [Chlamydomonas reinhardtii]